MCDRFHALPSQVEAEDWELFRLLELERLGCPERGDDEPEGGVSVP